MSIGVVSLFAVFQTEQASLEQTAVQMKEITAVNYVSGGSAGLHKYASQALYTRHRS